ncbi:MAG: GntR family transcriptional regulator [Microbacterium sp.]
MSEHPEHTDPEDAPLARSSLADAAYTDIRARILDGRIAPGERVTVRPIADRLALSATPIKAALVRLEREGLIASQLHRGFFVPDLGDADAAEIYQLREALDALAAGLAASGSQSTDRAALLARLCDEQEARLAADDIDGYRRLDVEFHRALWQASGNSRILRAGEPMLDQMLLGNARSARQPGRGDESLREHRGIIEAIRSADAGAATDLARAHIRSSHRSFSKVNAQ